MIKFTSTTTFTVTDPDGSTRQETFQKDETSEAWVAGCDHNTKQLEFPDGATATVPFDSVTEHPEQ